MGGYISIIVHIHAWSVYLYDIGLGIQQAAISHRQSACRKASNTAATRIINSAKDGWRVVSAFLTWRV